MAGTIFRIPLSIIKSVLALCIFAVDHLLGAIAGIFVGSVKGLSGLFGMGLRSFAVGLLGKKG